MHAEFLQVCEQIRIFVQPAELIDPTASQIDFMRLFFDSKIELRKLLYIPYKNVIKNTDNCYILNSLNSSQWREYENLHLEKSRCGRSSL